MPRKRVDASEYSRVVVRVERYEASVETAINIDLRTSIPYWGDEKDPVQTHDQRIELYGTCMDPLDRLGAKFVVSLRHSTGGFKFETLKGVHEIDKNYSPVYRKYRGGTYPVYRVPSGIATLQKQRGANVWTTWLRMDPHTMTAALTLLTAGRKPYLSINERKLGRLRWISDFSLQTRDPELE